MRLGIDVGKILFRECKGVSLTGYPLPIKAGAAVGPLPEKYFILFKVQICAI